MLQVINRVGERLIPYAEGLQQQRELVAARQSGALPDTLLLLEHAPTVTYGKAANPANRLLTPDEYVARGIELVASDRGGDVTYHGAGQLVGYLIIFLGDGNRDLHRYVRGLEEIVLQACASLGATGVARADFHAGIWTTDGTGYVAAVGVRVSRWVTHHGFALNVTDAVRENFETIVPCGVAGKRIATVSEVAGREITVAEAATAIAQAAQNQFAP